MSVFYKFKAWREPQTIPVDGTGISVWDLKKEIIAANNLASSAKDFDLVLLNSQTNEGPSRDLDIEPGLTQLRQNTGPIL
jgi:protein MPE1